MQKYTVSFRLDENTLRRLNTLTKRFYYSKSETLRDLILQEYIRRDLQSLEKDGIPSKSECEKFHHQFKEAIMEVQE